MGLGVGLGPQGSGGGGGGGGTSHAKYLHVQMATAISLPAFAWSAEIAWDDPAKNIDAEGFLETSTYKIFTIPNDSWVDIQACATPNTGSTGDTDNLWQMVTVADPTVQLQIDQQVGTTAIRMYDMLHKGNTFWNGDMQWFGFIRGGTSFQVRTYTGGAGANAKTDAHSYLQMMVWEV
jgi:hypothetical protein